MRRILTLLPIVLVCLAAGPAERPASGNSAPMEAVGEGRIPTPAEFEQLLKTDPVAALDACLARFKRDIHGYHCTLQKQESLSGKLGPVEIIRQSVREEPFATTLFWEQGMGSAKATLYVRGENGGRMKVKTKFFITTDTDPNGILARGSSRYSIEDAGLFNGTRRTYVVWKTARDRGELHVEYLGKQSVTELGNRECYVLRRTCKPAEIDSFRLADKERRDASKHPKEATACVTIYIECETWLQSGSRITATDGSLIGAYYFRDMQINPAFTPQQFTPAILK